MKITATAKNIKISPQKVRLVVDQIRKMTPTQSIKILDYLPKRSSPALKKVISSAIANAKNNYGIGEEALKFAQIQVGPGPVFKRYRAVARGRAHTILKRTSHIIVVLEGEIKKSQATSNSGEIQKILPKSVKPEEIKIAEKIEIKNNKTEKVRENGPKS